MINGIQNPSSSTNVTDFFRNASIGLDQTQESNISLTQLNKFKEDMLKQLKDIENKMYLDTIDLKKEMFSKVNMFEKTLNEQGIHIASLNEKHIQSQVQYDKLVELDKSYRKLNEESMTQSLRIKNLDKSVQDNFYKYDRLYLDNLCIPGLIGDYCKFKNFKDFIESNQNQLQSLLNFKNKHTLDLKNYKEKLENIIGQFTLQVSQIDRNNKDYTNLKLENIEKIIKQDRDDVDKRVNDNRLENTRYAKELILSSESLKAEKHKIEEFKSNILHQIQHDFMKYKELNCSTIESFETVKSEFDSFKRRFNDIAEFIKDIRFRRNLGVEVQKRETKDLSNKIEFNENYKQRSNSEKINKIDLNDLDDEYYQDDKDLLADEDNGINYEEKHKDKEIKEDQIKDLKKVKFKVKETESLLKNYINGKSKTSDLISKKNIIKNLNKKDKPSEASTKQAEVNYKTNNNVPQDTLDTKLNKIIGCIEEEQNDDTMNDLDDGTSKVIDDEKIKLLTNELTTFKNNALNKIHTQDKKISDLENIKHKYDDVIILLNSLLKEKDKPHHINTNHTITNHHIFIPNNNLNLPFNNQIQSHLIPNTSTISRTSLHINQNTSPKDIMNSTSSINSFVDKEKQDKNIIFNYSSNPTSQTNDYLPKIKQTNQSKTPQITLKPTPSISNLSNLSSSITHSEMFYQPKELNDKIPTRASTKLIIPLGPKMSTFFNIK